MNVLSKGECAENEGLLLLCIFFCLSIEVLKFLSALPWMWVYLYVIHCNVMFVCVISLFFCFILVFCSSLFSFSVFFCSFREKKNKLCLYFMHLSLCYLALRICLHFMLQFHAAGAVFVFCDGFAWLYSVRHSMFLRVQFWL